MKRSIFTIFALFLAELSFSQVVDLKKFTEPKLEEGQCHTLVDSKVYLKDIKNPARVSSVAHIIADLGEENIGVVNNTETESYFFCKVKCILKSEPNFIWITAKDLNEKMKTDMNAFVCPGLSIENVPASETLSIKTTVPIVFEAVRSQLPDIHFRLRSVNYKLTGAMAGNLIVEFYNTLKIIQSAYAKANSALFQEAAEELTQYLPDSPESWYYAKNRSQVVNSGGFKLKRSLLDYTSGTDLVNLFFFTNGQFLQYID